MRRHLLAAFVACVSIAGATEAALSDGAPYEYSAAPVSNLASGWRGFYLGAHLGGTWGSSSANGNTGVTLDDSWSCFAERSRGRRHARVQLAGRAGDLWP